MFLSGIQELLILLVDVSASMYVVEDPNDSNKTIETNKHKQVQSAIESLVKRINKSPKQANIQISIVPFAEKAVPFQIIDEKLKYYSSKKIIQDTGLSNYFNKIRDFSSPDRKQIGKYTSLSEAFKEAKNIVEDFCTDDRISPENKFSVTIMLFSDGDDNMNKNFVNQIDNDIDSIKSTLSKVVRSKTLADNFCICCIAIGKDALHNILLALSSPFSIEQQNNLEELKQINPQMVMVLEHTIRCYLSLNATNDTISDDELEILRNFMFLVTNLIRS